MENKEELLKECPYCGGKAHIDHIDKGWNVWFVSCNTRGCSGRGDNLKFDTSPSNSLSIEEARNSWNTRTKPSQRDESLEFKEEMLDQKTWDRLADEARKMADEADCSVKEYFAWLEERCKNIKQPPVSKDSLVPISEEAIEEIRDCINHYVDQTESKDVDRIIYLIRNFGQFPARVPTVEEIKELIKNNDIYTVGVNKESVNKLAEKIHQLISTKAGL